MTTHIIAWIVVLAIGILTVLITEIVVRVPVRNCPNCAWHTPGQCKHPTASQVPELPEIQMGMWRCPWREPVGLRGGVYTNPHPSGPRPDRRRGEE